MRTGLKLVVGLAVAGVLLATVGTWTYINVIRDDQPAALSLDSTPTTSPPGPPADDVPTASTDVTGTWKATSGSRAGYRVNEILFGQKAAAVGRTDKVTGDVKIDGTTIEAATFTVDMTTVTSDESRRDRQFQGRIMETARFPTSTFRLTKPIVLDALPADGVQITAPATGQLTLHGTAKAVTFQVQAKRTGTTLQILANIPITFAEWGIPNPSAGPADTEDHGVLEVLLVLTRG